ncbi:hypothetical protein O181_026878 [Austropuccinia psidii MF-1]|uniref:J domain-containing protein n=1 Tax=Austropuccinia psidii MF-1 TaxID=1389203 RepID=A0A9Q3H0E8_9BASI|nr:hypothetical protein [Austropuccinia psidii MF-1]
MGANQSHSAHHHSNQSHSNATDDHQLDQASPEDLYAILQVTPDATSEEIKKSFKKLALIHHPDKNFANVEQATQRFAKIQQAYEILSDEDERAFYDRHRDELLNSKDDELDEFDPTHLTPKKPRSSSHPGITVKQLLRFFDATLWNDDFSDSSTSFFTIYRNLFDQVSLEEKVARNDSVNIFPSFGTSESSYDQDLNGSKALKHFYSIWSNFGTQKTFEWIEPHHVSHQTDRRMKRLIEKENQRARENARKEYNETVRSLVNFIKKRDPRFISSTASNPAKWRAQEIQRIKRELREAAERRATEREHEAKQFREQSWQRTEPQLSDEETIEEANSAQETESEAEEVNDWYCVACKKDFNTQGAWDNHERSKKHKQNAHILRKQMIKEDVELSLSNFSSLSSPLITVSSSQQLKQETSQGDIMKSGPTSPNDIQDNLHSLSLNHSQSEASDLGSSPPSRDSFEKDDLTFVDLNKGFDPSDKFNNESEIEATEMVRKRGKRSKRIITPIPSNINEVSETLASELLVKEPNDPVTEKREMSKREKRKAKEAIKKQQEMNKVGLNGFAQPESCNVCNEKFPSKTKLFEHLKIAGHASAIKLDLPLTDQMQSMKSSKAKKSTGKKKGNR